MNRQFDSYSVENWLANGGVADDWTGYGPPSSAFRWGEKGCPLAPRQYRMMHGHLELPLGLLSALGEDYETLADLSKAAWECLPAGQLTPQQFKSLKNFLYELSVPEDEVAIPGGVPISWLMALPISPRLRGYFRRLRLEDKRQQIFTESMSCGAIMAFRHIGKTLLIELLCVLEGVESHRDASQMLSRPPARPKIVLTESQFRSAIGEAVRKTNEGSASVLRRIEEFAEWAYTVADARTLGEAISYVAGDPNPPASWRAVVGSELSDVIEPPKHPYDIIESWVTDELNDKRMERICRQRISNPNRIATLQELADDLGISRERVRQIEAKVLKRFHAFMRKAAALPVKWHVDEIRRQAGTAAPFRHVERLLMVRPGQTDHSELLLKLAGYKLTDEWLVSATLASDDPTKKILDRADEIGFIDLEFATEELNKWGIAKQFHEDWLLRAPYIRNLHGRLVRWDGNLGDKLVVGLSDLGHPASIDTLLEHIQEDKARGTAHNALSEDPRVVRANRSEWALSSWGLPEYSSIAISMRDLIYNSGRHLRIEDIIGHMRNAFGTAESSSLAYCKAPMFVFRDGWVSLRDDLSEFEYENVSAQTACGVFPLGPERASLLVEVNHNLLRGSGRPIPSLLGAILNIPINKVVTFRNDAGVSVNVSYPETSFLGPTMGSVRSLAESLGAELGQYLTIVLDRADMSVIGTVTKIDEYIPSWELVERLTGMEISAGLNQLGHALNCSEGEVRSLLKSRGDHVVAQGIPEVGAASIRLDDALSRLQAQLEQR